MSLLAIFQYISRVAQKPSRFASLGVFVGRTKTLGVYMNGVKQLIVGQGE
jgi:hypothetical protein